MQNSSQFLKELNLKEKKAIHRQRLVIHRNIKEKKKQTHTLQINKENTHTYTQPKSG